MNLFHRNKKVNKFKFIIIALFLCLVFLFILQSTYSIYEKRVAIKERQKVVNYFQEELIHLGTDSTELADSQEVKSYFQNRDLNKLIEALNIESRLRDIQTMLVVDKNGTAITRIPTTPRKGDNIFINLAFGRYFLENGSLNSFIEGVSRPIMLASGSFIKEDDHNVGAIFVAQEINQDYLRRVKDAALDHGYNILVLSREGKIVADTFSYKHGSFQGVYDYNKIITSIKDEVLYSYSHNGKSLNTHITLFDQDGQEIGLVILRHKNAGHTITKIFFVLLVLTLWVIILSYGLKRKIIYYQKRGDVLLVILLSLVFIMFSIYIARNCVYRGLDRLILFEKEQVIYNSTISLDPSFDIIQKGSNHPVSILVDSGGEHLNAFEVELVYDPTKLSIKEVLTTRSICKEDMFIIKDIDNNRGRLNLSCIIPSPGFSAPNGVLADITFRSLSEGGSQLVFGEATKILANDGLGTNVLRESYPSYFDVVDFNQANLLNIHSNTHSNSDIWYNNKTVKLSWLCRGHFCTEHVYSIDQQPNSLPLWGKEIQGDGIELELYEGGQWYFHLASQDEEGRFIQADHFRIQIDDSGPEVLKVNSSQNIVRTGEIVRLEFEAADKDSGIKKDLFYVKLNEGLFLPTRSQLNVAFSDLGRQVLTVRVFDNAGNIREEEVVIEVVE